MSQRGRRSYDLPPAAISCYATSGATVSPRIHYLGQLHENSMLKVALDQITEGQLQFTRLEQHFDTLVLSPPDQRREYRIHAGKTEMAASLKKQFPGEGEAIDEFMRLMKVEREEGNHQHEVMTDEEEEAR